ncbi:MAG: secondary thiamine-phosphate synthase enzyme YjbQ [Pyrinomonadaceae bacterium]|nr:secondary thiamine-phosphate synthase enzyme YjbQ [Pyrinomonadaceae bacterium]
MAIHTITVASSAREKMIDITSEVAALIDGKSEGICIVFTQHTTCGLTINENADPDVQTDMLGFLRRLIPQHEPNFRHFEHNSDAHIKSSLVGSSVTVPFRDGRLLLGRWQGIYLCEFDGPRERRITVSVAHT